MRIASRVGLGIALTLLGSTAVRAQTRGSGTGPGRIVVTVRDAAGSDSLVRGSVCTSVGVFWRCARETTGARFEIANLPAANYAVSATCETGRQLEGKTLGSVTTRVADATPVEVVLTVSFDGCDMRPLRRVAGTMVGHHLAGFETSRVSPCQPDEWFVAADSNRMTWLTFSDNARGARTKRGSGSPIFMKDDKGRLQLLEGYEDFFVQLVGTLEGPGRFGHLGNSAFQFVVDSVVSIKPGAGGDCQRVLSARQPGTKASSGPIN